MREIFPMTMSKSKMKMKVIGDGEASGEGKDDNDKDGVPPPRPNPETIMEFVYIYDPICSAEMLVLAGREHMVGSRYRVVGVCCYQ
jgi:hypothetical protein